GKRVHRPGDKDALGLALDPVRRLATEEQLLELPQRAGPVADRAAPELLDPLPGLVAGTGQVGLGPLPQLIHPFGHRPLTQCGVPVRTLLTCLRCLRHQASLVTWLDRAILPGRVRTMAVEMSPWARGLAKFAASKPGSWFYLNVANPVDRRLLPATGGRISLSVGQPVLCIEVRGAKTGKIRRTPLLFAELDGNLVIIASATGKPKHPAWYRNVVANPRVKV